MSTLGDYIHLTWKGYATNTEKGTNSSEAEDINQSVTQAQTKILKRYADKISKEQARGLQDRLNLALGFKNAEEGKSNVIDVSKEIREAVENHIKETYPNVKLTKKLNVEREVISEKTKNVSLKEDASYRQFRTLYNNFIQIMENYKAILKAVSDNQMKAEEKAKYNLEKIRIDIQKAYNTFKDLINSYEDQNDPVLGGIKDFFERNRKNTYLRALNEAGNGLKKIESQAGLSSSRIQDTFGRDTNKYDGKSFIEFINELAQATYISSSLASAKGYAFEDTLDLAQQMGLLDLTKEVNDDLKKSVLKEMKEAKFSNGGKSNLSQTFIDLNWTGGYNPTDKKNFSYNQYNIAITSSAAQAKVDVTMNVNFDKAGDKDLTVSAKNYSFSSLDKIPVMPDGTTGITVLSGTPLLSILYWDTNDINKDLSARYANHLLNIFLHREKDSEESWVKNLQNLKEIYTKSLYIMIAIKAIIGEGMMRYSSNLGIQSMQGADVFIVNNARKGQILVIPTAVLTAYAFKNIKDNTLACFGGKGILSELSSIENTWHENGSEDRISSIISKLYTTKVSLHLQFSFNELAKMIE